MPIQVSASRTTKKTGRTALIGCMLGLSAGCAHIPPAHTHLPPAPVLFILKLHEAIPNGYASCVSPFRLWVTLYCGPGRDTHVLASGGLIDKPTGVWSTAWPQDCDFRFTELDIKVMVNHMRCSTRVYRPRIDDLPLVDRAIVIEPTVECNECGCGPDTQTKSAPASP